MDTSNSIDTLQLHLILCNKFHYFKQNFELLVKPTKHKVPTGYLRLKEHMSIIIVLFFSLFIYRLLERM